MLNIKNTQEQDLSCKFHCHIYKS